MRVVGEYRTSSATWSRCLAGPFFLAPAHIREGLNFAAPRSVGLSPREKLWLSICGPFLPAARAFLGASLSAARKMARPG
jgi:hypothetical protein